MRKNWGHITYLPHFLIEGQVTGKAIIVRNLFYSPDFPLYFGYREIKKTCKYVMCPQFFREFIFPSGFVENQAVIKEKGQL